jgi:hypothetical protein
MKALITGPARLEQAARVGHLRQEQTDLLRGR